MTVETRKRLYEHYKAQGMKKEMEQMALKMPKPAPKPVTKKK